MKKNTLIVVGVIIGVAVVAALAVLLMPVAPTSSSNAAPAATDQPDNSPTAPNKSFDFGASGDNSGISSATITNMPTATGQAMNAKERTMESIHDAMTTYSAEGVPTLQPLLSNPDSEIRYAAIEAMKQLGVPEAAAALKAAAKKVNDPAEKKTILEAAEFAELPSLIDPSAKQ